MQTGDVKELRKQLNQCVVDPQLILLNDRIHSGKATKDNWKGAKIDKMAAGGAAA